MTVQSINDTLSIGVAGSNDVASLLLSVVTNLCKASFKTRIGTVETCLHTKAQITYALLNRIDCVFLCKLILEAHTLYELLSLAAAVFESLNDIAVAHIDSVDNTLSGETNLACNLLDSSLNIATTLLQRVEVNVKSLCKLADSKAITLNSRLNAIGI